MSNNPDIAIVGANTPVAEALLEQLAKRNFPLNKLIPLAFDNDSDTTVEFADKHLHVQDIATFNFSSVKLVFLCQLDDSYQGMVDRILDAGCRIIELESNLQNAPVVDASLLSAESPLDEPHIRSASGLGVVLTRLLQSLLNTGIQSVQFTVLQSASDKGKAGIDELAMQTTSLLNTRPIKPVAFKQQIAFNAMTDDSELNATGYTRRELELVDDLQQVLFNDKGLSPGIQPSFIHIPVFYGVCLDVYIQLDNELDLADFEQSISDNPDVELKSEDELVTPVSHAAQMDKIFISRVRKDLHGNSRFNFWCVTDTIKSGSAINGVQIAEILVKHHL